MPRHKPVKDKGGRPPKCTPKLLGELETLLLNGTHPRTAVLSLGISPDSYTRWKDRGAADGSGTYPQGAYGDFCGLLDRAPAIARAGVDVAVHRLAKSGDLGGAKLFYQRVGAENFAPQNLTGLLTASTPADDDDVVLTTLAEKIAGLTKPAAAATVPPQP